jgi:excisionase family DNA binding protein
MLSVSKLGREEALSDNHEYLTIPQVAELCGVAPRTVNRWIKAGHFPGARKGMGRTSPYHIPRTDVEAFLAQQDADAAQVPEEAAGTAQDPALKTGERATQRIALIVEDDVDARAIFELTLQSAGFVTSAVETGQDAVSWLKSMAPNLVILDLQLPDITGVEVLHYIRSTLQLTDLPVIVATAYPDMAVSIQDDVALVLEKPVRFEVLQTKAMALARAG